MRRFSVQIIELDGMNRPSEANRFWSHCFAIDELEASSAGLEEARRCGYGFGRVLVRVWGGDVYVPAESSPAPLLVRQTWRP